MIGLFSEDENGVNVFGSLGTAIAGSINTAITAVKSWTDEFKKGEGWQKLGDGIADMVSNAINGVKWKEMKDIAANLGTGIADAVNAFVTSDSDPIVAIAKAAANLVDTGITFWYNYVTKMLEADTWKKLGTKIGEGVNAFLKSLSEKDEKGKSGWQKLAKLIIGNIGGLVDMIAAAVKTIKGEDLGNAIADVVGEMNFSTVTWKLGDLVSSLADALYDVVSQKKTWTDLGDKIGEGINAFFSSMGKKKTSGKNKGKTGWEILGEDLTSLIDGAVNMFKAAFKKVKWQQVGSAIGEFLGGIDWAEVTIDLVELGWQIIKAIGAAVTAWAKKDTSSFLMISAILLVFKSQTLLNALGGASALTSVGTTIGTTIGTAVGGAILAAVGGFELGKEIGKLITGDDATYDNFTWSGFFDSVKDLGSSDFWKYVWSDISGQGDDYNADSLNSVERQEAELEEVRKKMTVDITGNITDTTISEDLETPNIDSNSNLTTAGVSSALKPPNVDSNANLTTAGVASTLKPPSINTTANMTTTKDNISSSDKKTKFKNFWATFSTPTDGIKTALKKSTFKGFTAIFNYSTDSIPIAKKVSKSWTAILASKTDKISSNDKTLTGFKAQIESVLPATNGVKLSLESVLGGKATGGIFSAGTWKNIPQYAAGTLNAGTVFVAGEAGAEAVAHINGKTEVLNQSQLASAIASAVVSANTQQNVYLQEQNRLLRQILEKDLTISESQIGKSARNYAKEYFNRTGNEAYSF
jgi:hypothetical protein